MNYECDMTWNLMSHMKWNLIFGEGYNYDMWYDMQLIRNVLCYMKWNVICDIMWNFICYMIWIRHGRKYVINEIRIATWNVMCVMMMCDMIRNGICDTMWSDAVQDIRRDGLRRELHEMVQKWCDEIWYKLYELCNNNVRVLKLPKRCNLSECHSHELNGKPIKHCVKSMRPAFEILTRKKSLCVCWVISKS